MSSTSNLAIRALDPAEIDAIAGAATADPRAAIGGYTSIAIMWATISAALSEPFPVGPAGGSGAPKGSGGGCPPHHPK